MYSGFGGLAGRIIDLLADDYSSKVIKMLYNLVCRKHFARDHKVLHENF